MSMQADHRPEGHVDAELIAGLEPDQLVAATSLPLGRLHLGRGARIGLWVLRIFVLLISAAVIYTFVVGVVAGG